MSAKVIERDSINYIVAGHSVRDTVNYHEMLVLQVMREMYRADATLCRCYLCVEDIFALALNGLPAQYIQPTSREKYRSLPHDITDEDHVVGFDFVFGLVGERVWDFGDADVGVRSTGCGGAASGEPA